MEMRIENGGNKFLKKMKKNPWMLVSIILAILLIFPYASNYTKKGKTVDNAIEFINSELLKGQGTAELNEVTSEGDFYVIVVDYQGRKIPTYFTKDGKYFINGQLVPISEIKQQTQTQTPTQPTPTDVPKSDKPEVKLFIWSY